MKKGQKKAATKKEAVRKKPGPKPGTKRETRKITGHEMPPKVQKAIENKYGKLTKSIEVFGENVAAFVYNTNTEAGMKAMKAIPGIVEGIKEFKKEIRTARMALKPIFAS